MYLLIENYFHFMKIIIEFEKKESFGTDIKALIRALVEQDIKINWMLFGLENIGFELPTESPDLAPIIFKLANISADNLNQTSDAYYEYLNTYRGVPPSKLMERLEKLSFDDFNVWL